MNITKSETIHDYSITITDLSEQLTERDLKPLINAMDFFKNDKVELYVINHDDELYQTSDIQKLIEEFNDFYTTKDDSDEYKVKLFVRKKMIILLEYLTKILLSRAVILI